jgi:hypothetical protein
MNRKVSGLSKFLIVVFVILLILFASFVGNLGWSKWFLVIPVISALGMVVSLVNDFI